MQEILKSKESDFIKNALKWFLIVIGSLIIFYAGLIVSLDVSIKFFSGVRVEITNRDSLAMQQQISESAATRRIKRNG